MELIFGAARQFLLHGLRPERKTLFNFPLIKSHWDVIISTAQNDQFCPQVAIIKFHNTLIRPWRRDNRSAGDNWRDLCGFFGSSHFPFRITSNNGAAAGGSQFIYKIGATTHNSITTYRKSQSKGQAVVLRIWAGNNEMVTSGGLRL